VIEDADTKQAAFAALYGPLFDSFRIEQQAADLERVDITANSDARPVAYYLNLRRWVGEMGLDAAGVFLRGAEIAVAFVHQRGIWVFLAVALSAGAFGLAARTSRLRRAVLAGAMTTSGCAGMLGQLALVFMYQNAFGQLYRAMGMLCAAYMLGLVMGGATSTKRGRTSHSRCWMLLTTRCLMVASSVSALLLSATDSAIALAAALFFFAFVFGLEYPIANRVYREDLGGKRAAGVLHAMDHLGAASATFIGGALVLPLVGPRATLIALTGLHLAVLVGLAASLRRVVVSDAD